MPIINSTHIVPGTGALSFLATPTATTPITLPTNPNTSTPNVVTSINGANIGNGVSGGTLTGPLVGTSGSFSGVMAANSFVGSLSGNASTASHLVSPVGITLYGDVSGTIDFDGSSGVVLPTTLASTGVAPGTYSGLVVNTKGLVISASSTSYFASTGGTLTGALVGTSGSFSGALAGTVAPSYVQQSTQLSALLAQGGVLLDTFWQAGDADDTASLTRAVTAGVPILLGPRTYVVNNFATGSVSSLCLKGISGISTIQRTSASGSQFFSISAAKVFIEGVIFDFNKSSVSANQWGVYCANWT